jgi:hypothetical protein
MKFVYREGEGDSHGRKGHGPNGPSGIGSQVDFRNGQTLTPLDVG